VFVTTYRWLAQTRKLRLDRAGPCNRECSDETNKRHTPQQSPRHDSLLERPKAPLQAFLNVHCKMYLVSMFGLERISCVGAPAKHMSNLLSTPHHHLPLPAPNWKAAKATLKWLASCVKATGPHIQAFPLIPCESPHWSGRVSLQLESYQTSRRY
jgi:hypothetical protein